MNCPLFCGGIHVPSPPPPIRSIVIEGLFSIRQLAREPNDRARKLMFGIVKLCILKQESKLFHVRFLYFAFVLKGEPMHREGSKSVTAIKKIEILAS